MPSVNEVLGLLIKRISALTRTATDADLTDSEYMAVDNVSAHTRKITVASLATWVFGRIKRLATTIIAFRTGDVILVDGPNGTAKMPKDNLLEVTVQNALAGNVATELVPNEPLNVVAGHLYVFGGKLYIAKETYNGPWDASKFKRYSVDTLKSLSDLNNDICTRNSIQLDNGVIGYYLNTSGNFVESNSHYVSDYFAVSENDVVVWTPGEVTDSIVLALYDSNKQFVSYYRASSNPRTVTLGSGYSFIRASFKMNATTGLSIAGVNKNVAATTLSTQILSSITVESEKKDLRIYNGVIGYYLNTSGNFVESNSHYVSDYFAVSENGVVVWTPGEVTDSIVLALYDSDKKFVNYYRASSNPRTVTIGSGYSFIRASFKKDSVVGLSINGVKKDVSLHESAQPVTTIRFGTYNTGDFAGLNMTKGSQEVAMAMREAIAEANCDVMATQEDTPYFNTDLETLSRDECFGLFKNYTRRGSSSLNYKAFASNYKIANIAAVNYTGGYFDHSYFLTGDLVVSGIVIKLICVHLDWSDNTRRQTQLSQLAAYTANYDNVIIMGDFNPENCINYVPQFNPDTYEGLDTSDTDLAILENVGFKAINGGYLPKKNTYYEAYTRNYVWRCDNILVKSTDGKLVYKDLGVVHKDYMNDHFIVYSDISILSD